MGEAVIYVRVSDSRQVDNTSLEAQERICRSWCQTNGLEVDQVFTDAGESAKTADRTEFQRMFAYLRRTRGKSHMSLYTSLTGLPAPSRTPLFMGIISRAMGFRSAQQLKP
jgi:predicted site-specific integrase-resolvase